MPQDEVVKPLWACGDWHSPEHEWRSCAFCTKLRDETVYAEEAPKGRWGEGPSFDRLYWLLVLTGTGMLVFFWLREALK